MKKHVDGRTTPVDGSSVGENHHFPTGHAANHHVPIPRTDEDAARDKKISGSRFVNFQGTTFIETFREHFSEAFGHVLNHENRRLKIRRNLRQDKLQGVGATRRYSDGDDAARRQRGAIPFFRNGRFFRNNGGRQFAAGGAFGHFDFGDQLIRNFFQMSDGGILGFGDKVDRAERQRFESGIAAFFQ